ncbi:MAG: hypothetical protein ACP5NK_01505 [Thermoplasmata archaeon]
MKYLEAISVVSYATGSFALVTGIFMSFILDSLGSFNSNSAFFISLVLFVIFLVTAIVTGAASKAS